MSATHKAIRNDTVAEYVLLQDEKNRSLISSGTLTARLNELGSGVSGTGGIGSGNEQAGEIGDTVDALLALIASPDAGFKGINPTISGFSSSSLELAVGATADLVVSGANFLPFPLVKLHPAQGADIDVSASVVMRSGAQFVLTIPGNAAAEVYTVYFKNPIDTTAAAVTSAASFTLTRV